MNKFTEQRYTPYWLQWVGGGLALVGASEGIFIMCLVVMKDTIFKALCQVGGLLLFGFALVGWRLGTRRLGLEQKFSELTANERRRISLTIVAEISLVTVLGVICLSLVTSG